MPEVQETVTVIPGSALLWRITPRPAHSAQVSHLTHILFLTLVPHILLPCSAVFPVEQMYNFTSFAMTLNELEPNMEGILALTDCRLRPDIRAMENGDIGNTLPSQI